MTAISIDGNLNDWSLADSYLGTMPEGYKVYGRVQGDSYIYAFQSAVAIGANTTMWFNTDRNTATGYQIFGFAGGAEYNVNIGAAGTAALYTGGAGQTLVNSSLTTAFSADRTVMEISIAKASLGNATAVDALFDINDSVFLPGSYSEAPLRLFNSGIVDADGPTRVGIVYSATTAANYFDSTAYSQLFMSAQSQVMQAGVAFDLLTEDDLTSLATLAKYDSIIFPSFRNVQASQVSAIASTLEQATREFGVGLITGGDFMTNDQTGAALAGDSYAQMKTLFGATRVDGGFPATVEIKAADANNLVLEGYTAGETIRTYTNAGWNAYTDLTGKGQAIATETVNGQTYTSVLATQTGGRNILFSTEGVMSDNNLLWQAVDYSVHGTGLSVGLQITREAGILASRNDMDQSQEAEEVNPANNAAGIYDKLLPILDDWKHDYNFVGSYYVNVGNDAANGQTTDWSVSAPYYAKLLASGNELGLHSYTHPENTNLLTPEQIAFQFGQERTVLEANMSAYLGHQVSLGGAAVPGAPEKIATSTEILKYVDYLSGGYSSVGAGYPGAIGYLTPGQNDKVYIAPNMSFDFTLVEFQNRTPAEAAAIWKTEFAALASHAEAPVIVWPWHDYGPTQWSLDSAVASRYTQDMFTSFIKAAYDAGVEFVTLDDLADRTASFAKSSVKSTVAGDVITATVASSDAGNFALDVDGQGTRVIKSVANWYAYDNDSVFLPKVGGTYTITMGAVADDVTHITDLPMRAELISLTGNGTDLSFSAYGEGLVTVDLKNIAGPFNVTGATVVSRVGDIATLRLGTDLIVNGGFENVTTNAGSSTNIANGGVTGWVNGATSFLEVMNNYGGIIAPGGTKYIEMDADNAVDTLRQSVVTSANTSYELTFDLRGRPGYALTTSTVEVWFANRLVATIDPASTSAWTKYDLTLTGTGGAANLEFREVAADNNTVGALIDNVSLFSITPSLHAVDIRLGASANLAPVITTNGGGAAAAISVTENLVAVTTVKATDADAVAGASLSYSIKAGGDAAQFAIDASSGVLTFIKAPDFEAPADTDKNNSYLVTVVARDSFGATDEQALTVNVTDVKGVTLNGNSLSNTLNGTSENDVLNGNVGRDVLNGGGGSDILVGGSGADRLTGGEGADIFRYLSVSESRTGTTARDIITDFVHGVDLIDLSAIDANTGLFGFRGQAGDQAFTFLPTAGQALTGQGQLHYLYQTISGQDYTIIQGMNDSLPGIDFELALLGRIGLTASDFIL